MMEILVRGNKIDITDAMKDYVKEKLSKLEKYTLDDDVKATVLVKVRNYTQKVEVTIPLKTLILRAEEESEDFYSAVDLVVNKLERQIRKNKTKLKKKEKGGVKEFNIDDIIDLSEEKEVVKRKKIEIKPMNLDEAILQMELLGHDFYVFKNTDNNKTCVLYRRKNNDYGLIEEE